MMRDSLRDLRSPFYVVEHELLDRGLSVNAIAVYNVLRRHADRRRQCFPGIRAIARSLGIGKTSVGRALEELRTTNVIRVIGRIDVHGDRATNLYNLLPAEEWGCPATGTPVPPQVHGVPLQVHGCPATGTELYPIEQEPQKKSVERSPDPLWESFSQGFRLRLGHLPKRSSAQKRAWAELVAMHPPDLILAKIDAWWDYHCPRLDGSRSAGAFLQWFDDIPIPAPRPAREAARAVDWCSEMLHGTPRGIRKLHELLDDVTEPDARIRTLIHGGYAHDETEAQQIIAACGAALA